MLRRVFAVISETFCKCWKLAAQSNILEYLLECSGYLYHASTFCWKESATRLSWKERTLSFAGKSTQLQSILQSIHVYLMSSGWVPKMVLAKIDGYCRKFLWSKDGKGRGLALAAWDTLYRAKRRGPRNQILETIS